MSPPSPSTHGADLLGDDAEAVEGARCADDEFANHDAHDTGRVGSLDDFGVVGVAEEGVDGVYPGGDGTGVPITLARIATQNPASETRAVRVGQTKSILPERGFCRAVPKPCKERNQQTKERKMNCILRTTIAAAVLAIPAVLSAADYTVFRVCEDQHVLRTSDGAEAGRVQYIVLEPTSHRVVSAIVSGGVVAEKHIAIPITAMRFGADRQVTLTNITRERLVAAPVFETTRLRTSSVIEPAFVERSYTHFGLDAAEITRTSTTVEGRSTDRSTTLPGSTRDRATSTTESTRDAATTSTEAERARARATGREAAAGTSSTTTEKSAAPGARSTATPSATETAPGSTTTPRSNRDASSATDKSDPTGKTDRKNAKSADKETKPSSSTETDADATRPGRSGTAPGKTETTPGRSGTTPGQSGTTPGQSGTTPGKGATTAPGQSGTTPGQSATTPGQSGTTPGKSGTAPGQSDRSDSDKSAPKTAADRVKPDASASDTRSDSEKKDGTKKARE